MNTTDARALFSRHLDLSRLRNRPRGIVACIFHRDKSPSLSVDLDAGVFHCFGCGAQGGARGFAQLVGEHVAGMAPPHRHNESELQRARRRVMEQERWRQARMADWWPLLHSMVWLRRMERLVASARIAAPDTETGWAALADAALVERFVDTHTAALEGILASGRVA